MFQSKKEQQREEIPKKTVELPKKTTTSAVDTIIGENSSIKGNIHTDANLRIDGQFEGEVMAQAEVVIGHRAFVNANVVGKTIMVYGEIHGNIVCKGLLEIMSTGKVYGDIQIANLKVQEGAILQGRVNMTGVTEILEPVQDSTIEETEFEIVEPQTTA